MKEAKLIHKTMHGIKYYSNETDADGYYRLWRSKTHPNYKHWMAIKKKKIATS
jgi:hypothetical protein